jgi:hypothetical protein
VGDGFVPVPFFLTDDQQMLFRVGLGWRLPHATVGHCHAYQE